MNNANGLPQFQDYWFLNLISDIIDHQQQAIIPSYRFDCCGNITEWGVDVHPGGGGNDMQYTLNLQVWRPSPAVETTGCYSLVGANHFTSITLSSRVAVVTPLPQEQIQFQPGDVLGFYVESARGDGRGVVVLNDLNTQGDGGYETEEVWHADIAGVAFGGNDCPFPVGSPVPGSQRILTESTDAAPVISVSYYSKCTYDRTV